MDVILHDWAAADASDLDARVFALNPVAGFLPFEGIYLVMENGFDSGAPQPSPREGIRRDS